MHKIIREAKAPIATKVLLPALAARGIHLKGDAPEKTLANMLSRMPEKVVRSRHGYWLADVPPPARADKSENDLEAPTESSIAAAQATLLNGPDSGTGLRELQLELESSRHRPA